MSQGSFKRKITFLGQKVCPVARVQTDRRTDGHTDRHESEYRGHPFRVSGIFPSTYHQGSVQKSLSGVYPNTPKKRSVTLIICIDNNNTSSSCPPPFSFSSSSASFFGDSVCVWLIDRLACGEARRVRPSETPRVSGGRSRETRRLQLESVRWRTSATEVCS